MSNSVKFRPRRFLEKDRPKAIQVLPLADGGHKVVDATVKPEAGKQRPVVFEFHPTKKRHGKSA